jgi:hypothetical protein
MPSSLHITDVSLTTLVCTAADDSNWKPSRRCGRSTANLSVKHLYRRPSGDFVRTTSVLIATDIKSLIVLPGSAILANIALPSDLYESAEFYRARTCYCVASAADIRARCGDARLTVGLAGDRIEAGDVSVELVIFARLSERHGNAKPEPKHWTHNAYKNKREGPAPVPTRWYTISNTSRRHSQPLLHIPAAGVQPACR